MRTVDSFILVTLLCVTPFTSAGSSKGEFGAVWDSQQMTVIAPEFRYQFEEPNESIDPKIFASRFAAWNEYAKKALGMISLRTPSHYEHPLFHSIVDLGPRYLVYMVSAMRSGEYNNVQLQDLCEAMFRVTKISRSYLGGDDPEVWVNWWDVGRSKASQQFELAYANWRSSLEGPDRDKMYQNLLDLGIMALPFAIEKISAEKNQSLPVQIGLVQAVDYWTGGQVMKEISKRRYPLQYWSGICCKWWDARKNEWLLPPLETKADR